MKIAKSLLLTSAAAALAAMTPLGRAAADGSKHGKHGSSINHVLLLSVDGMHALDLTNCLNGISGVNGGAPYCPHLAQLARSGRNYVNGSTSKPSDSFPGLMAIVGGGSPKTIGAYYDVAYDRVLAPPQNSTGNGLLGGTCTPNVPNGTRRCRTRPR